MIKPSIRLIFTFTVASQVSSSTLWNVKFEWLVTASMTRLFIQFVCMITQNLSSTTNWLKASMVTFSLASYPNEGEPHIDKLEKPRKNPENVTSTVGFKTLSDSIYDNNQNASIDLGVYFDIEKYKNASTLDISNCSSFTVVHMASFRCNGLMLQALHWQQLVSQVFPLHTQPEAHLLQPTGQHEQQPAREHMVSDGNKTKKDTKEPNLGY